MSLIQRSKEMTDEAEKEINNFKNNSINQIKDIANQVTSEILNELSIKNYVDEKIISSKIDEISKKRIGDLN
jgi:ABC-type methionine transport system ATPase subunit